MLPARWRWLYRRSIFPKHDSRSIGEAPRLMKYLAIIGLIVAAIVLSNFLFDFYQWNQQQSCATSGGRNCGGGFVPLNH